MDHGASTWMGILVYELLKRFVDQKERKEILRKGIENGKGIYTIVHSLAMMIRTIDEENNSFLGDEDLCEIKRCAIIRIGVSAINDSLSETPCLNEVLIHWRDWSGIDEPKRYVKRLISTDKGIIILLSGFLNIRITNLGTNLFMDKGEIDLLSQFINPMELLPRVKSIKQNMWDKIQSERGKIAIDEFIKCIEKDKVEL
jgi:predicted KAP-like P-loop ATPase